MGTSAQLRHAKKKSMTQTRNIRFFLTSSLALLFSASALVHASPTRSPGPYVDAASYLPAGQVGAWYDLIWKLKKNFDDVCGDTFCEGEFSNLEALRYACSVNQATGRIGECAWTIAGSNEEVDPATGAIEVQKGFWQCRTPLAAGTTLEELLAALAGDQPIYAPLPGSDKTIMEGLIDGCSF
jgi:hypothetical protein